MKKTIEKYFCDVCGKEARVQHVNYPVVFHTEQDEGRACPPYIAQKMLELCQDCLLKALVIDGVGAQGINTYTMREDR